MLDIIEFWMVGLILFRDLFVTGLRMAMEKRGLSMVTSTIAKAKTVTQMGIIAFILTVLGLKGLPITWAIPMLDIVREYRLVYNLTLAVTIFTVVTGITYLYSNRNAIQYFLEKE
jgi:phosphatidylglycerophosphate synthase|tara:strand:- start:5935 stop:6279 length:345 start_codon:yes stop_codon:yes gene_type:complete